MSGGRRQGASFRGHAANGSARLETRRRLEPRCHPYYSTLPSAASPPCRLRISPGTLLPAPVSPRGSASLRHRPPRRHGGAAAEEKSSAKSAAGLVAAAFAGGMLGFSRNTSWKIFGWWRRMSCSGYQELGALGRLQRSGRISVPNYFGIQGKKRKMCSAAGHASLCWEARLLLGDVLTKSLVSVSEHARNPPG